MFQSLWKCDKAEEYLKKALVITTEIGDRREASCYGSPGTVFHSLRNYDEAKLYLEKALVIRTEIGDRKGEADDYGNLGVVFQSLGNTTKLESITKKRLSSKLKLMTEEKHHVMET